MNKYGIYDSSWKSILRTFSECPEIDRAILFGSRAMENFKKGSDIDIAIDGEAIGAALIARVSSLLNGELPIPYYVDLVDYQHLDSSNLKKHIDDFGIEIYRR